MTNKKTPRTPAEAAQMLIDDPQFLTLGDPSLGVTIGTIRLRLPDRFGITPLCDHYAYGNALLWSSVDRDVLLLTYVHDGHVYAKIHWPCGRRRRNHSIEAFSGSSPMLFEPFISKPQLRVAMGLKAWPGMK